MLQPALELTILTKSAQTPCEQAVSKLTDGLFRVGRADKPALPALPMSVYARAMALAYTLT